MAAAALEPTSRHSRPAQAPPLSPMRSSHTNVSRAPGGWPETWVIHESGWKSRILDENERSAYGMSVTDGTWRRYSLAVSSRWANPRCQPSIIASANAHAPEVAHVAHGSARQGSRPATAGPQRAVPMPISTAGTVPHPTWRFHHPKIGATAAYISICRGVLLISGVTIPR